MGSSLQCYRVKTDKMPHLQIVCQHYEVGQQSYEQNHCPYETA